MYFSLYFLFVGAVEKLYSFCQKVEIFCRFVFSFCTFREQKIICAYYSAQRVCVRVTSLNSHIEVVLVFAAIALLGPSQYDYCVAIFLIFFCCCDCWCGSERSLRRRCSMCASVEVAFFCLLERAVHFLIPTLGPFSCSRGFESRASSHYLLEFMSRSDENPL